MTDVEYYELSIVNMIYMADRFDQSIPSLFLVFPFSDLFFREKILLVST